MAYFFYAVVCVPLFADDSTVDMSAGRYVYGKIDIKPLDTVGNLEELMPLIRSLIVCRENNPYNPEDIEKQSEYSTTDLKDRTEGSN
jgi:hypothetical protein